MVTLIYLFVRKEEVMLCCPVCHTNFVGNSEALKMLAVAHGIALTNHWALRRKLKELARANVHLGIVSVEDEHRNQNDLPCSCLILMNTEGRILTARYERPRQILESVLA